MIVVKLLAYEVLYSQRKLLYDPYSSCIKRKKEEGVVTVSGLIDL